jgi:glutathione S-transferase
MPWGCVPVLEWQTADGKCHQLSQSLAILRFLGRQFNRGGGDPLEMAKCEEYVQAMSDIVRGAEKYLKIITILNKLTSSHIAHIII